MINIRHPGEGRNLFNQVANQIPACAGMTREMSRMTSNDK